MRPRSAGAHPLDSTQAESFTASPVLAPDLRAPLGPQLLVDRHLRHRGQATPGNGTALAGPTDKFTDVAVDSQYQFIGEDHIFTVLATYINERQRLDASVIDSFAENVSNHIDTFKLAGEYSYQRMIGGRLVCSTSPQHDTLLYQPEPPALCGGRRQRSQQSRIARLDRRDQLPAWLNTKLAAAVHRFHQIQRARQQLQWRRPERLRQQHLYLLVGSTFEGPSPDLEQQYKFPTVIAAMIAVRCYSPPALRRRHGAKRRGCRLKSTYRPAEPVTGSPAAASRRPSRTSPPTGPTSRRS